MLGDGAIRWIPRVRMCPALLLGGPTRRRCVRNIRSRDRLYGPGEFSCGGEGFDRLANCGLAESLDHADVDEKSQRHAAAQSSSGDAAASESARRPRAVPVGRREAQSCIRCLLMVAVRSRARAIWSACSSMSMRYFPTHPYIQYGPDIYALCGLIGWAWRGEATACANRCIATASVSRSAGSPACWRILGFADMAAGLAVSPVARQSERTLSSDLTGGPIRDSGPLILAWLWPRGSGSG